MDLKVVENTLKGLEKIRDYLYDNYLHLEEEGAKLLATVKKTIKELNKNL